MSKVIVVLDNSADEKVVCVLTGDITLPAAERALSEHFDVEVKIDNVDQFLDFRNDRMRFTPCDLTVCYTDDEGDLRAVTLEFVPNLIY